MTQEEAASGWSRTFFRVFDRIVDVCAAIACGLLLFQVITVSLDVILRYFFDVSYRWFTALNEWSLVFVAFLGAAWLEREGGHTRDDSLLEAFGATVKGLSERAGWVIGLAVCAFLVWYGAKATWYNFEKNTYDFFKMQGVPIFWVYAVIPFGALLWLIQIVRQLREGRSGAAESGL